MNVLMFWTQLHGVAAIRNMDPLVGDLVGAKITRLTSAVRSKTSSKRKPDNWRLWMNVFRMWQIRLHGVAAIQNMGLEA